MTHLASGTATAACIACALSCVVQAQSYPVKPIKIIAGHSLGSSGDVALRLVSVKMGERLGQPTVVENRLGANGSIAALAVARSAPDGYNILSVGAGTMVTNIFLVKDHSFDSQKDFSPIGQFAKAVTFLTVHSSLGIGTVQKLVDYARKNPGKLSYGSTGTGSPFHLMGETFKLATGVDIVHVPYAAGRSAVAQNDFLTGRIEVYFPSYTNVRQYLQSGKVQVIATTDSSRYKRLPEVPTISETVPAFRPVPSWNGMFGPVGLPAAIVKRLNATMVAAVEEPDIVARMDELGLRPMGNSPEEFGGAMREEIENFGKVARALGLQPQ